MRCTRCQDDNPEQASRCGTCGATLLRPSTPPPAPDAELAVPERREATLLFADLGGYTELNQRADVEEVAEIMGAIKAGAAEIIQTYGGVVNQFIGDEVMAVFGLPHGNDDDPRRAISAALALHAFIRSPRIARLSRGRHELTFHTGIETGLLLAHSRDLRDGLFDLTGTTVNLAARLRSQAGRDEVLIGPGTLRRVQGFFRTEALPPRVLKGILEPVTPHRVHARRELRSSFDLALERGLTPYVGRRKELAALEGYLAEAGRGDARLVSVLGPPGVGKTRLLHELLQRARSSGFTVLRGQCQSYGNIPPFQPFLETLEEAVGLREAHGNGNAEQQPGAPDTAAGTAPSVATLADAAARVVDNVLALDPALQAHLPVYLYLLALRDPRWPLPASLVGPDLRRAVIAGLADVLLAHARRRPVLVVVEDWHWADEASDALFAELARATVGHPIMAVVTYRAEQLLPGRRPLSNRQLALGHFDEAGTGALLCELLQTEQLPKGLARAVHETSDGNPFFVEEICHALRESGVLVQVEDGFALSRPLSQLGVPHSVQATVRARVDRLSRPDKDLLKLASVIGAEFSLELLEPLCEDKPGLLPALERLQARAHILPSSLRSYRFKHPIVHDVVYDTLLLQRRRELHGMIARAIEAGAGGRELELEQKLETLAHHYGKSDDRERAVRYAELAARKAERSFSLDQARRLYQAALSQLDELEPNDERKKKRVELSLRWASALVHNPASGQIAVLQRSLDYATALADAPSAARCLSWMGWIEYTLGNQRSAIAYNEQSRTLSAEQDGAVLRFQADANIAMSYTMAARHPLADELLSRALSGFRPELGESANATAGYAQGHVALLRADQGDFPRAAEALERAREAVHASGRFALLGALFTIEGITRAFAGDYAGCARCASRVREVAERIDGAYQRHMAAALEALYLIFGAGDPRGYDQLRGAALALESRGIGLALSFCFASLAEALALAGRADEAVSHAEAALARAEAWDALGQTQALRARALARLQLGEQEAAASDLQAALQAAREKQSPREELITRLLWAEHKGGEDFAALAERFAALQMPYYAARARRAG